MKTMSFYTNIHDFHSVEANFSFGINRSEFSFRINWSEFGEARKIKKPYYLMLTLRARKTPIGAYMGHLQNDVIEAVLLVRMKNGWHNHLSVLNFLSFCVDRVFINALVLLLYAFKVRKYFHNFSLFQKSGVASKG